MKSIYKAILPYSVSAGLTILTLIVALAPSTAAKHRAVRPRVESVTEIAHVTLPGTPASQIFLHERGDKEYLFIGDKSERPFTVVDIADPNAQKIMQTT